MRRRKVELLPSWVPWRALRVVMEAVAGGWVQTLRVEPPLGSLCQRLATLMAQTFFPMSVPTPPVRLCAIPARSATGYRGAGAGTSLCASPPQGAAEGERCLLASGRDNPRCWGILDTGGKAASGSGVPVPLTSSRGTPLAPFLC